MTTKPTAQTEYYIDNDSLWVKQYDPENQCVHKRKLGDTKGLIGVLYADADHRMVKHGTRRDLMKWVETEEGLQCQKYGLINVPIDPRTISILNECIEDANIIRLSDRLEKLTLSDHAILNLYIRGKTFEDFRDEAHTTTIAKGMIH